MPSPSRLLSRLIHSRVLRTLLLPLLVAGTLTLPGPAAARPAVPAPHPLPEPVPCDQGPINAPTAARASLEQLAADWGVFCEGAAGWRLEDVLQPVPEDSALRCALTGGQPYANIHCYRNLLPAPAAGRFTLRMTFEYSPTTTFNNQGTESVIQALEFSLSKWQGGRRNEWALQWRNVGVQAPGWRYWDPFATPDQWAGLAVTDTATLRPAAHARHTLTFEGEIVVGRTHYLRLTLDKYAQRMTQVAEAQLEPAHADGLAVAVQLDGNAVVAPYEVIIDQVGLTTTPLHYAYIPLALK